jgi:hypothetical protein
LDEELNMEKTASADWGCLSRLCPESSQLWWEQKQHRQLQFWLNQAQKEPTETKAAREQERLRQWKS